MDVSVNYLAVLLAAVSSMIVGSVWYARSVFGESWAKLTNVDMNRTPKRGEMVGLMVTTFLSSLLMAYILAHVSFLANIFFKNSFLQDTVTTAFWLWLGFIATRVYMRDTFEGRHKKLTALTVSHELVTVLVMALIIGVMGY